MELSLNSHDLNDEQRKQVSRSIFNSEITDNNTPVNAMRRVIVSRNRLTGEIIEDLPHQDGVEEDPRSEDSKEMPTGNQLKDRLSDERVSAELSSDEDKPNQPPSRVEVSKAQEKDKNKKGKAAETAEAPGYNEDDIDKGKKIMANPNFKSNLDRLRSQFKARKVEEEKKKGDEPKLAISEVIEQPKIDKKLNKPSHQSKAAFEEDHDLAHGQNIQTNPSDIILGSNEIQPPKKKGLMSFANRGIKDIFKGKSDKTPKASESKQEVVAADLPKPVSALKQASFSKIPKVRQPSASPDKKQVSFNDPSTQAPEGKAVVQNSSPKLTEAEWNLKNKLPSGTGASTNMPKQINKEDPANGKTLGGRKKKTSADDSGNSWDDSNPFK